MKPEYIEIIKTGLTVAAAVVGTLIGARLTLRNTIRTLELQNEQRMKEIESEREYKERENLRLWFEDYAVNKCIDPLITDAIFLKNLIDQYTIQNLTQIELKKDIPHIPMDACGRLFTLTGVVKLVLLLQMVRLTFSVRLQNRGFDDFVPYLNEILFHLVDLRRLFLNIALRSKSDIHKVCANKFIADRAKSLNNCIDNAFKVPSELRKDTSLTKLLQMVAQHTGTESIHLDDPVSQ